MKVVLVVDDDPRFCALVSAGLRSIGVATITAATAHDAACEMAIRRPDLIILDGNLPDMDGFCWLTRLRECGNDAGNIPVIFSSATWRDTESYKRLHEELHVIEIIQKPIQIPYLVQTVSNALQLQTAPLTIDPSELDDFQLEIIELINSYKRDLPDILRQLRDSVHRIQWGNDPAPNFAEAIRCAHTVRGTAGSLGLKNIAKLLEVVECKLKEMRSQKVFRKSDFRALFNCIAAAAADLEPTDPGMSKRLPPPNTVAPIRVLVVDDDKFFLKRIEHLLVEYGMNVTAFSDTKNVRAVIEQAEPDVILLDLDIPEHNGFDVCKELRSIQRWRNTPIVIVTADALPIVETASLDAGATKFVAKPINNAELVATIRELAARQLAS